MITINVTHRNGIELAATLTQLITLSRVVHAKASGTGLEILYARSLDRRDRPEVLIIEEDVTDLGLTAEGTLFLGLTVLNNDNTTELVYFNEEFVSSIYNTRIFWNGDFLDCVQVNFVEGAFTKEYVFAVGAISDDGDVTTTTAAPTTTTEEVTTTEEITTTEEVTTTEEATTTTAP